MKPNSKLLQSPLSQWSSQPSAAFAQDLTGTSALNDSRDDIDSAVAKDRARTRDTNRRGNLASISCLLRYAALHHTRVTRTSTLTGCTACKASIKATSPASRPDPRITNPVALLIRVASTKCHAPAS